MSSTLIAVTTQVRHFYLNRFNRCTVCLFLLWQKFIESDQTHSSALLFKNLIWKRILINNNKIIMMFSNGKVDHKGLLWPHIGKVLWHRTIPTLVRLWLTVGWNKRGNVKGDCGIGGGRIEGWEISGFLQTVPPTPNHVRAWMNWRKRQLQ